MVETSGRTALVLQGGGALGAYQVGAYRALAEAGFEPDWVCGTSIGAINAALIVGNAPDERAERLEAFWRSVAWPTGMVEIPFPTTLRRQLSMMDALRAFLFGQPNFFWPRLALPFFALDAPADVLSYWDPSPLRGVLSEMVDFARINSGAQRLSLGAVRVTTGDLVFFDSARHEITPQHVMAAGAMPPNFPGVRVDGELYWDGACVSNTPLRAIYEDESGGADLVFMIDLFEPLGDEPSSFDGVKNRKKDIDGASRSAAELDWIVESLNLQRALRQTLDRLDGQAPAEARALLKPQSQRTLHIVHLCYASPEYESSTKDHDFSQRSIADRIQLGHDDMRRVLTEAPWARPHGDEIGARLYRRATQALAIA